MALTVPDGRRGLAHFQLESRRNVLKKCSQERTFNELYILEDVAASVKFIHNLPFSKRLEVYKLFKYQEVEENTTVYKVRDLATCMYIIFTGSVKVSTLGQKANEFTILGADDFFGEAVLLKEDRLRRETVTANEKCELVVLTKEDYDSILKTELSQEVKEKVETLKNIKVLRGISDLSIQRLARLLIPRTFAKNRVISFQGEEAMEMYFMKSGECRVVMEVHREPKTTIRPLPQAAVNAYRSPNLSSETRNANPHFTAAEDLDLRSVSAIPLQPQVEAVNPLCLPSRSRSVNHNNVTSGRVSRQLVNYKSCYTACHNDFPCQEEKKDLRTSSSLSFVNMSRGTGSELKDSIKGSKKNIKIFDCAKSSNPAYTLKSFLKDFQKREPDGDLIADLDFSDKHALSWNTGTNMSGMLRGDISDGAAYQCKFENWAKGVVTREKKRLCGEASINQEFASSISIQSMRNSWPARSKKPIISEDTVFLDVGALHPGDFFGEIGLLHHSRRKASILTVTAVEVLVLSKWDFNRQVDKDIVECLSANDYKKIEDILRQYQKTRRWAHYKKKVMQEVLAARKMRFPNLYEHHMGVGRGMPCTKRE